MTAVLLVSSIPTLWCYEYWKREETGGRGGTATAKVSMGILKLGNISTVPSAVFDKTKGFGFPR